MHILIVGAGQTGIEVIQQVKKNRKISFVTADPRPEPPAVREGVIDKVDIEEVITPLTLEEIIKNTGADMILLAMPAEEMGLGNAPGIDILADSLRNELSIVSSIPVIEVARSAA